MSTPLHLIEPNHKAKINQSGWASQALAFCVGRTVQNMLQLVDFPELTRGDRWACVENGGWVGGHWVGLLWLAYAYTGDQEIGRQARHWAVLSPTG